MHVEENSFTLEEVPAGIFQQVDSEIVSIKKIVTRKRIINTPKATVSSKKPKLDLPKVNPHKVVKMEFFDCDDTENITARISPIPMKTEQCDFCEKSFKTTSELRRHKLRHRREFSCTQCDKSFPFAYYLRRHMTTHTSEREFQCDQCGKDYKCQYTLKKHINAVHFKDTENNSVKLEQKHECFLCYRKYTNERHLNRHMVTIHTKDKPHKCPRECGERFHYPDAVKWHLIKSHNEPAPFNCSVCDKKFIHRQVMETHSKGHETGFAVLCPVCGKSVSAARHLKRHLRTHSDEKPFECDICGAARFREKHQLNRHLKRHFKSEVK